MKSCISLLVHILLMYLWNIVFNNHSTIIYASGIMGGVSGGILHNQHSKKSSIMSLYIKVAFIIHKI